MGISQREQAQIVAKALSLEKTHEKELSDLKWIKGCGFGMPPAPPQRLIAAKPGYPKPVVNFKFDWVCLLVTLVEASIIFVPGAIAIFSGHAALGGVLQFLAVALYVVGVLVAIKLAKSHKFDAKICGYFTVSWVGYIVFYCVMKKFLTEESYNSVEYKNICASIDEAHRLKQLEFDNKYDAEMAVYNNETIPKYNQEKAIWDEEHKIQVAKQAEIYNAVKTEMDGFYAETRLIPQQYHNIPSLEYLDSVMSSSDYDIMAAIDSYERKLARDLEMERIREQQIANQMAEEKNQLLYEQNSQLQYQNDLQEQRNIIQERARRDRRNADIVNAIQNHNRNKYLKNR